MKISSLLLTIISLFPFGILGQSIGNEYEYRIQNAYNRLFFGKQPEYTEDFILADLKPDKTKPRLFDDFNGDLSGRYLSNMVMLPKQQRPKNFSELLQKVYQLQQKDGRFGNPNLVYLADSIDKYHMAQIWGNGRILVSMIDIYEQDRDTVALQSAKKLADFLCTLTDIFKTEKVIKKVIGMHAYGFICYTQINEGLARLYNITQNKKYALSSEEAYKMTQTIGNQHSHGYLTTLRGAMLLYNYTQESRHKDFVIQFHDSIVNSKNYKIFGGMPEYFGKAPYGPNDEGCSNADFYMLNMQMWQSLKETKYLEYAENCLLNQFYYNQFHTGEFGHHQYDGHNGFRLNSLEQKSWWCCTMHGITGLQVGKHIFAQVFQKESSIDFFGIEHWKNDSFEISIRKQKDTITCYELEFLKQVPTNTSLKIRKPSWANDMKFYISGKELKPLLIKEHYIITSTWKKGSKLKVVIDNKIQLYNIENQLVNPASLSKLPSDVYIKYGPYLLAADGVVGEFFLNEPNKFNQIFYHASPKHVLPTKKSYNSDCYLQFSYIHDGYYQPDNVVLRPISEISFEKHTYFKSLLKFVK